MVQFLLDNSIFIIFALFVSVNVGSWVYENFCYKDTPDDWFERMTMYEIMKKSYRKHPGFIGSFIRLSKDTHMVKQEADGSLTRVERG